MKLNIFAGVEYLLSHEQLARESESLVEALDNDVAFRSDFDMGRLNLYQHSFVAYHKGVLCGQSKVGRELYAEARTYYGGSNLAVFLVPEYVSELENNIKNKIGQ